VSLPSLDRSNRQITRDISNTLDSKGAFRFAAAATTDVSTCSVFFEFGMWNGHLRKLATAIFLPLCSYFGLMPQRLFIITERKHCLILYTRCKVCSLMYNLLYQFSQFPVSMEHLKLRKQTKKRHSCYRWTTTGLHAWPVDHSWNHAFCYRLPALYKVFICYLNANACVYVFFYNYVQLARSFTQKFYHASPLSASTVRWQNCSIRQEWT
jgi:hypothetical protein